MKKFKTLFITLLTASAVLSSLYFTNAKAGDTPDPNTTIETEETTTQEELPPISPLNDQSPKHNS